MSLIGNLSATFAISPTDTLNDMSSVGKQDVSVTFKLTPQLLTGKSYSSAVDKLATYVRQWGSKELDFKVGSGPQNSTTEGVFRIRLGQSSFPAVTGISTSLPSKSLSVPGLQVGNTPSAALTTIIKEDSKAVSILIGQSTSLPALASNASQIRLGQNASTVPTGISNSPPLRNISIPATAPWGTPSAVLTIDTKATSRAESVSTVPSTGFPAIASNASQPLKPSMSNNSNQSSSFPGLYSPPSSSRQMGAGTMVKSDLSPSSSGPVSLPPGTGSPSNPVTPLSTQSAPVTTVTGGAGPSSLSVAADVGDTAKDPAAAGAAAAAGILAGGGSLAAAVTAAGEAASSTVVAAGGNSAAAAAAKAAAEEAVRSSEQSMNEAEEEEQRLSSDNQRGTTAISRTPATTTLATVLPATSAPTITNPATTAPVTLLSNATMTSQVVSSTCAACATCPGFEFGAKWPDLGSTTSWADSDVDTENDWDAGVFDDEFSPEDANGEEGDVPESEGFLRRELRGRFTHFARKKRHLRKRIVAAKKSTTLAKCTGFTKFISKPPYYNAMNVVKFEQTSLTQDENDRAAMKALIRWAIPISTPPGDCTTVPKWKYLTTAECQGEAPLADGSFFSKAGVVGEPVWQVGGAPNQVNPNREVNVDHVYEAKYLDDFFTDLNENHGFDCNYLKKVWDSNDGSKLTNLFANLPSKTNHEFIGMARGLNSLKEAVTNKVWNKDLPLSWEVFGKTDKATGIKGPDTTVGLAFTIMGKDEDGNEVAFDPTNDLEELTTAAQILDLINTSDAIKYMSAPNDRIYAALQAYGIPCQGGQSWADRYKTYILNRFAVRNVQLQDLFTKVLTEIGPGYRTEYMAAWKQVYPMERMQLPPPTSWAAEFPAIQQAIQAKFASDPASLGKRQAVAPPPAGACMLNAGDNGQSSTGGIVQPSIPLAPIALALSASSSAPAPLIPIATTPPAPIIPPPPTSQTSTAASAVPSNGDPCGPAIQDNPTYPNTCAAKVNLVSTPPPYGVYCGSEGPASINWAACEKVFQGVCGGILWTEYPKGAWVWSDPGTGCAVGTWMPPGSDGKGAGAAMTPSLLRCYDLISQAMIDSCSTATGGSNMASVNVGTLPSFSDPSQTGSQVDIGYPSYIVAGKSPTGLKQLPWGYGWSNAEFHEESGLTTTMNANNQKDFTGSTVLAGLS